MLAWKMHCHVPSWKQKFKMPNPKAEASTYNMEPLQQPRLTRRHSQDQDGHRLDEAKFYQVFPTHASHAVPEKPKSIAKPNPCFTFRKARTIGRCSDMREPLSLRIRSDFKRPLESSVCRKGPHDIGIVRLNMGGGGKGNQIVNLTEIQPQEVRSPHSTPTATWVQSWKSHGWQTHGLQCVHCMWVSEHTRFTKPVR